MNSLYESLPIYWSGHRYMWIPYMKLSFHMNPYIYICQLPLSIPASIYVNTWYQSFPTYESHHKYMWTPCINPFLNMNPFIDTSQLLIWIPPYIWIPPLIHVKSLYESIPKYESRHRYMWTPYMNSYLYMNPSIDICELPIWIRP